MVLPTIVGAAPSDPLIPCPLQLRMTFLEIAGAVPAQEIPCPVMVKPSSTESLPSSKSKVTLGASPPTMTVACTTAASSGSSLRSVTRRPLKKTSSA